MKFALRILSTLVTKMMLKKIKKLYKTLKSYDNPDIVTKTLNWSKNLRLKNSVVTLYILSCYVF